MLAKRKRETERDERKRAFSSFRSFITSKRDTHRERECEKNKKATSSFIIGAFADRKQTQHTSKKKKSASRAQGPLTFLIFHISMFSSWSSPMDAILFSSLSSLFSLFCVRTRERSDVVFLSSRESRPPTCLKKK